jgi:hypothetical protein
MSVEIKLKTKKEKEKKYEKKERDDDVETDIASDECDINEINKLYSNKCGNNNKEQLKIDSCMIFE